MVKDEGIVIGEFKYMDSSKILTVLTKRHGKITILSKGAMRPKSAVVNSASLFSRSDFILYRGKTFFYSYSANVIKLYYELRKSTEKYFSACYIADLCNNLIFEGDESNGIVYDMLVEAFNVLAEGKVSWKFLIPAFQIKIVSFLGFMPELEVCYCCGETHNIKYFDTHNGAVCIDCNKYFRNSEDEVQIMKYILGTKFANLKYFAHSDKIFSLLHQYIQYCFEIEKFKSLEAMNRLYAKEG